MYLDNNEEAIDYSERLLRFARNRKDRRLESSALFFLASTHGSYRNDPKVSYPKAVIFLKQSLEITRELKDREDR